MRTGFVVGGVVLVLFGLFSAWVGTPAPDDPTTPAYDPFDWDFFCLGSGLFIVALGLGLLVYGIKYREVPSYGLPPSYPPSRPMYPPSVPAAPRAPSPPPVPEPTPPPEAAPAATRISTDTMRCHRCGADISFFAKFCNECGAPQA